VCNKVKNLQIRHRHTILVVVQTVNHIRYHISWHSSVCRSNY